MKTKKQSWNLRSGNRKGFILSLDAAIAVMIVFIFIAVSTFYIAKANEETLSRVQVVRAGSDIMNVLDRENVFETKTLLQFQGNWLYSSFNV